MASKPNKGRLATAAEREHAGDWVKLYREAELAPEGRLCVNPEAPYDEQDFIYADNPEPLLQLLDCFAKFGKFVSEDTLNIKGLVLRSEIAQLRKRGMVKGGAVQAVAEKRHLEKRTVERLIRRVTDKE